MKTGKITGKINEIKIGEIGMDRGKIVYKESNCYVPFEPKKQDEFNLKNEIRKAVGSLEVGTDEVLLASYAEGSSVGNYKYDLENILFYNIGTGAFSKIFSGFPKEIAFQMGDNLSDGKYLYKYEVIRKEVLENKFAGKDSIAEWNDVPIGPKQGQNDKPDRYYVAIRMASSKIIVDSKQDYFDIESFGIKITLTIPNSARYLRVHPASVMKPLLDGVICAFHGENEESTKAIQKRFKEQHPEKLLQGMEKLNLFGNHNYLTKSNRWNPEDDRLRLGWIILKCEGDEYKMSGSIYKL